MSERKESLFLVSLWARERHELGGSAYSAVKAAQEKFDLSDDEAEEVYRRVTQG